ncbi:MAG: 3D domain-containing protein [Verrucomicrobiota bacterium]
MISRRLPLVAAALSTLLLASCGNTSLAILPKSSLQGLGGFGSFFSRTESFPTAAPSAKTLAAAATKPKDRHHMPVYAFADRTRIIRTTAYTASEADHIVYGNSNATGTPLRYTDRVRSAAADWSFYPVGTVFRISGLPYLYVVDDYGSALAGNATVDIYEPTKDLMNVWGSRQVEMTVVQWGSFTRSAEILRQRTGYGHCRAMLANIIRQKPDVGKVAKL